MCIIVDTTQKRNRLSGAEGKLVGGYLRLKSTQDYFQGLSESMQIDIDRLIYVNESTGENGSRGTWAHPEIAAQRYKCSAGLFNANKHEGKHER